MPISYLQPYAKMDDCCVLIKMDVPISMGIWKIMRSWPMALALYEASFDPRWFTEARTLMDQAITLFADEQNGGFFDTGTDHETLITRPKDIMDNATPAGNSVAIDVLVRLAGLRVRLPIENEPMGVHRSPT